MDIKKIVKDLCQKYQTNNPYELVRSMGIILQYGEKMEGVRGFYLYDSRIKLICISNNLPHYIERFVVAHELGHSVLHKQSCAPFLKTTFLSVDRMEIQANKFASELIISDSSLMECKDYTISQIAGLYGLPVEIIKLRLK